MSHFPKHYESILRESGLSNLNLCKLFDMPKKRLDNIRHASCRIDRHEFKLIKAFVNGFEAAQKNKETEPSTSDNMTHDKIKPCSNKECENWFFGEQDKCNCLKYKPENMQVKCDDYSA